MLVLSRKEGQTIQINDDITITVTSVGGNRVTLGIVAPKHMPIRRGELEPNNMPAAVKQAPITQTCVVEGCFA